MIVRSEVNTVLIHYDSLPGPYHSWDDEPASQSWLAERSSRLAWYCEWAAQRARSVIVLLPSDLGPGPDCICPKLANLSIVRYEDDAEVPLPRRLRGQVWLINGNQMPIVEWNAARVASRRRNCDVLMFGQRPQTESIHYPESVVIDGTGQVVRFRRHYSDSPVFADRWSGQASFLVASNQHAPAVITQILASGWNLDSIGALTRRFSVRWSSDPCVLTEADGQERETDLFEDSLAPGGPKQAWQTLLTSADDEVGYESAVGSQWSEAKTTDTKRLAHAPGVRRPSADPPRHPPRPTLNGFGLGERTGGRAVPRGDTLDHEQEDRAKKNEAVIRNDRTYLLVKRTADIIVAATGLVVLSPFLLIVGVVVKLTSPGPILFGHKRQGLGGKEFRCWKFRSMSHGAEALQNELRGLNEVDGPQFKIAADPRITPVGDWLRRTNIDEIPQLINVLVGQMSLVGPRPSPDAENQLCPAWRRARLSVKPGMTGLWQILRLRNMAESDFQEWIYYDIEYARHRSGWLDLQIVLHTPVAMYAPHRMAGFAARLERHGICPHFGQIASRNEPGPGVD